MKTIFSNTIIKYSIMLIGVFMLASCELNDSFVTAVQDGPNIVMYNSPYNVESFSHIANGSSYTVGGIKMYVSGPHMTDVSGDITFSLEPVFTGIPDSLQAKEGVNFSLPESFTLKASDNYLGAIHFKMLTEGIAAPLNGPRIVKLKVTNVSGDPSVIGTGRTLEVKLNYACPSNMQGIYNVHVISPSGIADHQAKVFADEGIGQYYTNSIGGWYDGGYRTGSLAPLNFGVKFIDVCGTLTVAATDLGGHYTNDVRPIGTTTVKPNKIDAQTGNLTSFKLVYNIDGLGDYEVVYTKTGALPDKAAAKSISKESSSQFKAVNSTRVSRIPSIKFNKH